MFYSEELHTVKINTVFMGTNLCSIKIFSEIAFFCRVRKLR